MVKNTYGNRAFIPVYGLKAAAELAEIIMKSRDNQAQVLIQHDDCDIYIVSWACRYRIGADEDGDTFVFMDEQMQGDFDEFMYERKMGPYAEEDD